MTRSGLSPSYFGALGTQDLYMNFRLTKVSFNTLRSCVVTILLLVTGPAGLVHGSDDEPFGILPQPLALTYKLEAIRGEVAVRFDLDRATATALLGDNPDFALADDSETVEASFLVTSQDIRVGDTKPYPVIFASLWLPAKVPSDSRIPNGATFVELEMWTDSRKFQSLLASAGIHAKVADITLEQVGRNWHYVLEDEYFSFQGIATPTDEPKPQGYSLPAYTTVWRRDADIFTIYTYYGHLLQNCKIQIEFAGQNDLLSHIAKSGYSRCLIETAWKARAGIYQREP